MTLYEMFTTSQYSDTTEEGLAAFDNRERHKYNGKLERFVNHVVDCAPNLLVELASVSYTEVFQRRC